MLSDKYIAGFFDADGCASVYKSNGKYYPKIVFSQGITNSFILPMIQEVFGGTIHKKMPSTENGLIRYELILCGSSAKGCIQRLYPHTILKHQMLRGFIECIKNGEITESDWMNIKAMRYLPRKTKQFPSRKWLAGYTDGDGCFSGKVVKNGSFRPKYTVSCVDYDSEGIELIQKQFGGSIYSNGHIRQYILYLSESKAKEFLSYFSKHLIIKKRQSDYIQSLTSYKIGKEIKEELKRLKAQQHRLNEMAVVKTTDAIVGLSDR